MAIDRATPATCDDRDGDHRKLTTASLAQLAEFRARVIHGRRFGADSLAILREVRGGVERGPGRDSSEHD